METRSLIAPLRSGGYFFDTARGQSPFTSLSKYFPILRDRLESTMYHTNLPSRV
ncbi:DUF1561 family protein [Bartonella bacilliformis]|uniref:DUF1561 family protein n=1 Tax=Bartonella bacilliformis TaxID=774 RepID=UPI0015CF6A6F